MDKQALDKDEVVINVKEGTVTVSSERFEELERAEMAYSKIKPTDIKWTLAELNNLLQHNLSYKLSRTVKKLMSRFARLYKKENDYVMTRDSFLLGLGLIITTTEYIPHAKLDAKTRDILDGLCYAIVKRENEEQ